MPELIVPTTRLRTSWLEARDEWGRGVHQDGSGLQDSDEVDTAEGFAAWVDRLRRQADESGEAVSRARARGIDRVLVTCNDENIASVRTIERNGGVLEDVRDTELGRTRRYWIDGATSPRSAG